MSHQLRLSGFHAADDVIKTIGSSTMQRPNIIGT
jgi:hypothetical protein